MPNRNYVKRPRARSSQSNKKKKVGEFFLQKYEVPGFRKDITKLHE